MPLDRRHLIGSALVAFAAGPARAGTPPGAAQTSGAPPTRRPVGPLDLAIAADAPSTPTGLAIARGGRMFVMMPRFTGAEPFTLGEVRPDGSVRPYPDAATNRPDPAAPQTTLFHVPNYILNSNA